MVRIFCWDIALDMGLESSLSLYVYPCLMTLILCPGFPVFWGWSEWAASLFFVMVLGLCFCAFLSIWCFCSSAGMSVVASAAVGWCWVPVTTCFLSGWGSLPASGPVVRWFVVTVHLHSGVFLLTLGGIWVFCYGLWFFSLLACAVVFGGFLCLLYRYLPDWCVLSFRFFWFRGGFCWHGDICRACLVDEFEGLSPFTSALQEEPACCLDFGLSDR